MRVLSVVSLQVIAGLVCWGCYLLLVMIFESGNWTPFGVLGIDIFKTIGATVVASAGLTAFAFCLNLFKSYED